ncbi:hypothetical protein [Geochorda subterranea]|uniref:Uncharacterized protein n=1 Tax=Geochorda subterranea TaxID=3109564 RepID=A0ABZ1BS45_9FIRM|nr:hypothetical protein [Limnochorda sp. LNt]WRP15574.1 hypothetical protein VLY81_05275 [Limnochorda sp. LNt]
MQQQQRRQVVGGDPQHLHERPDPEELDGRHHNPGNDQHHQELDYPRRLLEDL